MTIGERAMTAGWEGLVLCAPNRLTSHEGGVWSRAYRRGQEYRARRIEVDRERARRPELHDIARARAIQGGYIRLALRIADAARVA